MKRIKLALVIIGFVVNFLASVLYLGDRLAQWGLFNYASSSPNLAEAAVLYLIVVPILYEAAKSPKQGL